MIVGNTCAGKTTLARHLSQVSGFPHVELDALHWGPGWAMPPLAEFREQVAETIAADSWIVDGNYSRVRDLVWRRAQTMIWLDYGAHLLLWRLVWRTFRRISTRELLWGKTRETWRDAIFHRDSLFIWLFRKQWRRRREYERLLQEEEYAHLDVVRVHSPGELAEWLRENRIA